MQRAFGIEVPETLEEVCRPESAALLVYDMQAGIVPHVLDPEAFVGRVVRVLEAARASGVPVLFCRYASVPNELAGVFQLRTAMAWQRAKRLEDVESLFLPGSPAYELIPELKLLESEFVFDRLAMSAFVGTPLELLLRGRGVNALVVVGAVLEIGVEPTVRHGCDLGFIPVVVTDACGVVDEEAGRRSLASLDYAAMSLQTDVESITRIWGGSETS
jgi:nicotinamidase-related amidase